MTPRQRRDERGLSLIDMLVVVAIMGIVAGIAIPSMTSSIDRMRLGQSTREVERELQTAKQRAVGKGRVIRVRFNCPVAGQYRIVELIGSPAAPAVADTAANRCNEVAYPFPAADNNPMTRPNLDGPVRRLDSSVTFGTVQTIEFRPNGTAHYDDGSVGEWPLVPVAGVTVNLARQGRTAAIRVNGLGRITVE